MHPLLSQPQVKQRSKPLTHTQTTNSQQDAAAGAVLAGHPPATRNSRKGRVWEIKGVCVSREGSLDSKQQLDVSTQYQHVTATAWAACLCATDWTVGVGTQGGWLEVSWPLPRQLSSLQHVATAHVYNHPPLFADRHIMTRAWLLLTLSLHPPTHPPTHPLANTRTPPAHLLHTHAPTRKHMHTHPQTHIHTPD